MSNSEFVVASFFHRGSGRVDFVEMIVQLFTQFVLQGA